MNLLSSIRRARNLIHKWDHVLCVNRADDFLSQRTRVDNNGRGAATNQKADSFSLPYGSTDEPFPVSGAESSASPSPLSASASSGAAAAPTLPSAFRLTFEDFRDAYRSKSTGELLRAIFILKICSFTFIAENSLLLMSTLRRLLPSRVFNAILHPTFYRQFVAGNDVDDITATTEKLAAVGIRPMVAVPIEDDDEEAALQEEEQRLVKSASKCEFNLQRVLECVDITRNVSKGKTDVVVLNDAAASSTTTTTTGVMQLKVTALVPPIVVANLNRIVHSMDEETIVQCIQGCDQQQLHCSLKQQLDETQLRHLQDGMRRLVEAASAASAAGVQILVDAEYTYQNDAISLFALILMKMFNRKYPLIWNTYQCYLKNSANLERDLRISDHLLFCHGSKIVRGAYMEKERALAAKKGYASPVWDSKRGTDDNYNRVVSMLLRRAHSRLGNPWQFRDSFVFASHNEESLKMAAEKIRDLQLPLQWNDDRSGVFFAQLYGMCDHVTFTLGQLGFPVFKSLPYGSVDEVMPYLSRRSSENKSVIQGVRKETGLLKNELRARLRN